MWYPKLMYSSSEELIVGGHYAIIHPLRYFEENFRPVYRWAVSLDGQVTTAGSREITLQARFPAAVRGWRFSLTLSAQRRSREEYFGIGNSSINDSAKETDQTPFFYRSRQVRRFARGDVQRRLFSHLWLLTGFNVERWRIEPLSFASQLAIDAALGLDPTIGSNVNDISGKIGLVWDSRDDEAAPRRGMLIEAIFGGADADFAGDLSYTRTTVSASGYLPVNRRLVIAARVMGQDMGGTPRLGSFYLIDSGRRIYFGLGGSSHRALTDNRLLGSGKLLLNLDLRYGILPPPTFVPITLVGFVDGGRVFEDEDFRITLDGFKVGGGGGLFIQVGRAGIIGLTSGVGPDGLEWELHSRWPF
ncbi:MAG: BamA/TamA family outer membrane protein [Gemmatimonadales bacterium]